MVLMTIAHFQPRQRNEDGLVEFDDPMVCPPKHHYYGNLPLFLSCRMPCHALIAVHSDSVCFALICFADANLGGCARGEWLEAGTRRRFPPAVLQPHAPLRHVRHGDAGPRHDAVDHHLRLHGFPQSCKQVLTQTFWGRTVSLMMQI